MRIPNAGPGAVPTAPASDPYAVQVARWRALTEALIFAAAYYEYDPPKWGGPGEFLRILDRTRRPYDRARAIRRCADLYTAINTDYAHITASKVWSEGRWIYPHRIKRAHAANDDQTFRHRYAHLLPKRPSEPTRAERRTGISDEQRMRDADTLVGAL